MIFLSIKDHVSLVATISKTLHRNKFIFDLACREKGRKLCASTTTAVQSTILAKWQLATATFKQAKMTAKITDEIEMLMHARVVQHVPGIAAYWEDFACLYVMVFV